MVHAEVVMITYKYEFHRHSKFPFWYKAYGGWGEWKDSMKHPLRNTLKVYNWLKEHGICGHETADGACWKFATKSDLTAFLLRWS